MFWTSYPEIIRKDVRRIRIEFMSTEVQEDESFLMTKKATTTLSPSGCMQLCAAYCQKASRVEFTEGGTGRRNEWLHNGIQVP